MVIRVAMIARMAALVGRRGGGHVVQHSSQVERTVPMIVNSCALRHCGAGREVKHD